MNQGFYIKIGEETYYEGIDSGSMHLSELLCEKDVEFGTFCSNKFEVRLYGAEDVSGQPIQVTYVDAEDNTQHIFTGWIDTAKQTSGGEYREIIAYDALYKLRDVDITSWWNSVWTADTLTPGELLMSLLDYMQVEYGLERTFSTVGGWRIPVRKEDGLNSVTFGYMLNQLAIGTGSKYMLSVNREGKLRLVGYPNKGAVEGAHAYKIINENVQSDSEYEEYLTPKISGVKLVDSTGQIGVTAGLDSGDGIYVIKPSICFMNSTTQSLGPLVGPYYGELSGNMLQYKPANINMILPDFSIQLGDVVKTDQGYHYVTAIEFSGPQLVNQTVISSGSMAREDVSTVDIPVTDTVASLVKKINLSADEIKLQGDKIILDGATSFNDNVSIGLDGILRAVGAILKNMTIENEDEHYSNTKIEMNRGNLTFSYWETTGIVPSADGKTGVEEASKIELEFGTRTAQVERIQTDYITRYKWNDDEDAWEPITSDSSQTENIVYDWNTQSLTIGTLDADTGTVSSLKTLSGIVSQKPNYYDDQRMYPQFLEVARGTRLPANTDLDSLTVAGTYYINSGADLNSMSGISRILSFMGSGACRLDVIHSVSAYSSDVAIIQRIINQWGWGTYERAMPSDGSGWTSWKCTADGTVRGTVAAKAASWTNLKSGFISPSNGDAYEISVSMPRGYAKYIFHYGTSWSGQRIVSLGSNAITLQMTGATLQIKTASDTTGAYTLIINPLF